MSRPKVSPRPRRPLATTDWPLLGLLLWTGLGIFLAPGRCDVTETAIPLGLGFLLYVLLAKARLTTRALRGLCLVLCVAGLLLCLLAPLGMLAPRASQAGDLAILARWRGRLPDTFNANIVAGTLLLLLPFPLARLLQPPTASQSKLTLVVSAASALGMVALLVLSGSRGALVAGGFALLVLLGLRWPGLLIALPVAALAGLGVATVPALRMRAAALLFSSAPIGLEERLEIWSRALCIIEDFPLTGAGLGCFECVVQLLYPLFSIRGATTDHAHNLYLQIGIDVGLPGLIAYLVLLVMLLYGLIRAYRLVGQGRVDVRMLAAACLASLAGMGIHGLIDVATWGNKAAFLPWVVMGLGAGIERFVRRDMSGQNTEPDSGAAPRTG